MALAPSAFDHVERYLPKFRLLKTVTLVVTPFFLKNTKFVPLRSNLLSKQFYPAVKKKCSYFLYYVFVEITVPPCKILS